MYSLIENQLIMKAIKFLILTSFLTMLFGCSPKLTPFTADLQETNNWTFEDMQQIQFYLSQDIVLYRSRSKADTKIQDGKITMVDGKKVDKIVIESGTPGVLVFSPKSDRMAVSFENGNDKRFLMFGPSPKAGDKYVLLAKEWKRKKGEITYEGKTYYTNAESAYAALMVDLKRNRNTKVKKRTANGRTL